MNVDASNSRAGEAMQHDIESTVALTAAAPGWYVKSTSDAGDLYPVAAWAAVVQYRTDDGVASTAIEPVFLYAGSLITLSEWRAAMCSEVTVVAP